jgi:hypothetical protein
MPTCGRRKVMRGPNIEAEVVVNRNFKTTVKRLSKQCRTSLARMLMFLDTLFHREVQICLMSQLDQEYGTVRPPLWLRRSEYADA